MSVVRGKNVVFKANNKVIACLRSCTLNTSTSFVETTTVGSGKGAEFKPKKNTTTGSAEGVEYIAETGKITVAELRYLQLNHTLLTGFFESTDEVGHTATYHISFYIGNIATTGSVGDFATFQMDLQVVGDPTIELSNCAPTNITWTSVSSGPGVQDITLNYTPAPYGDTIDVYFSSPGGTTFSSAHATVPNDGSNTFTFKLSGVYSVKFVTSGVCVSETIVNNVGNP